MSRQSNEWACCNCTHQERCQERLNEQGIVLLAFDYCTAYTDIDDDEEGVYPYYHPDF